MIFSGLEHTGEIPFHQVNIHGLILDGQGRKMSKSLGNGIDPIEVIENYGADTLRFSLITGVTPGNDIRFNWDKVENTRNFANKIWNASRFVLMNLSDYQPIILSENNLTLADRWIISRLTHTTTEVERLLERYDLGESAKTLYEFIWNDFCDWYIELAKPRLFNKEAEEDRLVVQNVLRNVLVDTLRLLHPFMPFITEEIYQNIPGHSETIMLDAWPKPGDYWGEAVDNMQGIMSVIRAIRNIRAEFGISPGSKIKSIILSRDHEFAEMLNQNQEYIKGLSGVNELQILTELMNKPSQAGSALTSKVEIYVPLEGVVDIAREIERLEKDLKMAQSDLEKAQAKLNNENFLSRAPQEVIDKERNKVEEARVKQEGILQRIQILTS